MPKTILVPIDISQESPVAAVLDVATALAAASKARILLLNVVEALPAYVDVHVPSGIHEQATLDATAALQRIKSEHGLAETTEILVRTGHPSRTILDVAEEVDSDVVVLASHDPGPADFFLGSVAARVVRHAHCSVHVVRNVKR